MEKRVILLLHAVPVGAVQTLQEIAPDFEVVQVAPREMPSDDVLRRVEVVYGLQLKVFASLGALAEANPAWIQMHMAGIDRVDLNIVRDKQMIVTNATGIHGTQMSETLFGILAARARRLFDLAEDQRERVWAQQHYSYGEITGRTMAIIGAGTIGRAMASVARHGFKMPVIGVSRRGLADDHFDRMYKTEQFAEAVHDADIVVNLLPSIPATAHFFNDDAFKQMKQGSWFVNFGRGKTVDPAALLRALDKGQLDFAALDVHDPEPLPEDSPLWDRSDVFVTPHMSGLSVYYDERAFALFAENLRAYVATGKPARNIIDIDNMS